MAVPAPALDPETKHVRVAEAEDEANAAAL